MPLGGSLWLCWGIKPKRTNLQTKPAARTNLYWPVETRRCASGRTSLLPPPNPSSVRKSSESRRAGHPHRRNHSKAGNKDTATRSQASCTGIQQPSSRERGYWSHVADGEMEAQREHMTWPRSESMRQNTPLYRLPGSRELCTGRAWHANVVGMCV